MRTFSRAEHGRPEYPAVSDDLTIERKYEGFCKYSAC